MSSEHIVEPWNVGKEDSNTKSDDGGKKDIYILRWRVLESAQSAASRSEQVTPLHENQGEEIYALCLLKEIICQKRPVAIS